ncbi:DUF559 domain-containing protein [bacterium]|nr:DUF559 domain-containing protein [bacterium]
MPPPAKGGGNYHVPRYTQFALQQSKTLKRNMTDAERLLWHYLRGRRDFSFRKQAPIGNYIVDFVCLSKKLIIELDGAQHGDATGRVHDTARDKFLHDAGYRVLRFWNDEVFKNMDMVLDTIYRYLATPSQAVPDSPRPGGGHCAEDRNLNSYSRAQIPPAIHPQKHSFLRGPETAVGIGAFQARAELPPSGRGLSPRATGGGPATEPDIKYIPIKWDEGLRQQIGRASDFYRQNYCGCEFSIRKV